MTHGGMTTKHDITELNPKWVRLRKHFLEKYPQAKKLFAESGEKRDYQFRIKNVELASDSVAPNKNTIHLVLKTVVELLRPNLDIIGDEPIFNQLKSVITTNNFDAHAAANVISNYKAGFVITPKVVNGQLKQQRVSIGAVLAHDVNIMKLFAHDPFRAGKASSFDIVVTGHPIDVYGASTGRNWTSCMNMDGAACKKAAKHILSDIQNHTHIVYLVPAGGDIDTQAIARASFKMHHSITGDKDALLSDNSVYGNAPKQFLEYANKIMSDIFTVEQGMYILPASSYAEAGNPIREVGDSKTLFSASGWKKLTDEFSELHEDDKLTLIERMVNAINQMNKHDVGLMMDSIEAGSDFFGDTISNLESHHNFHEAIDALFDMHKFAELSRDYYDLEKELFTKLTNKNLIPWFVKTHYFNDAMVDILRGVFGDITINHDSSNMDTELSELDSKCVEYGVSDIKLTHDDFDMHGDLIASYVAAHFTHLYSAFNTRTIRKDEHVGAVGAEVLSSMFTDVISDFASHHGDEQPKRIDRIFDGVAHRYNSQHGEHHTTLDLLFRVLSELGVTKVSTIPGYEKFGQWVKQYLVDKFPSSLVLAGDQLSFRNGKDTSFMDKLSHLLGDDERTKNHVLDLIAS